MRLLAPFALGGDAGAKAEDVATQLNMCSLDMSSALAKLGAAGIVSTRHGPAISVEPPAIRSVLVQRVFFGDVGSLPMHSFLSCVQDRNDAIRTLIGASARGADISDLEQILDSVGSSALWKAYASLGPRASGSALARHPEMIGDLAEPALDHLPDEAIRVLLSQAQSCFASSVSLRQTLEPLRRWIMSGNANDMIETIERRRKLVKCAKAWWKQSRSLARADTVAVVAMCVALDSNFDSMTRDPGAGIRFMYAKVTLNAEIIEQLAKSWPVLMTVVKEAIDVPWDELIELSSNWCSARLDADEETQNAATRFFSNMLPDLALISKAYPGIQRRLAELATLVGVKVQPVTDAAFECLFPQGAHSRGDVQRTSRRLPACVSQLAEKWKNRSPDGLAVFLARLEDEGPAVGASWLQG